MNLDNNALLKSAGIGAAAVIVLSVLTQIPAVGLVCCCLLLLAYGGIGALYGYFAHRNGSALTGGSAALGGAIAAGIAGIAQGIVSAIVTLVVMPGNAATAAAIAQLEAQGFDVPPEVAQLYSSTGFGALGAVLGVCFTLIVGAILGAIGGAIYGSTQRNAPPPAMPASSAY